MEENKTRPHIKLWFIQAWRAICLSRCFPGMHYWVTNK